MGKRAVTEKEPARDVPGRYELGLSAKLFSF